ncbi:hypothetical protein Tco_1039901 [Tanacetum coccineum]
MIKIHTNKNVADLLTKACDFWSSVKVKTVNGEQQLQALVDRKKIIQTEAHYKRGSSGFEQIVDFLNANPVRYALTINPTIYTLCIKQFWAIVKAKTVNGNEEVQLQALVDGKKVIVTKTSVRRDLQLEDAEGIVCLPNADIFEQLALMGYEEPSQKLTFYKAFFSPQWKFLIHTILQCLIFLNQQAGDISNHKRIYVTHSHTKKVFGNIKREGKGFSGRVTPLFPTMMVQDQEEMGEEPIADEDANEENVPTHSNDPLLSGEDSLKLNNLMEIYTKLQQRVLYLENTKTAQAHEISSLKLRVKRLEKKGGSRTYKLKRLFKVGRFAQIVSSEDEGLGDQEDASKQGRKLDDIDKDAEVTLVDESQGRYGDDLVFNTSVLDGEEMFAGQDVVKKEVSTADPVTTVGEVVTTASVQVSAATTTITTAITEVDLILAQALAELRSAKPKVVVQELVQSTTTTAPSTIPKAKSITFRDSGESTTRTTLTSIPSNIKDKGKAKMLEPEKPLKMKEQIILDERRLRKLKKKNKQDEKA